MWEQTALGTRLIVEVFIGQLLEREPWLPLLLLCPLLVIQGLLRCAAAMYQRSNTLTTRVEKSEITGLAETGPSPSQASYRLQLGAILK